MAIAENRNLREYCRDVAERAKSASYELAVVKGAQKNRWLTESARLLRERSDDLAQANDRDLAAAPGFGLNDAQVDRLRLTAERIDGIARALEEIAELPDPIGEVIESTVRPNGLEITKLRVPLGVVFFIYDTKR